MSEPATVTFELQAHPLDGHVPTSHLPANMRLIRFLQPFLHQYRAICNGTQPNIAQRSDPGKDLEDRRERSVSSLAPLRRRRPIHISESFLYCVVAVKNLSSFRSRVTIPVPVVSELMRFRPSCCQLCPGRLLSRSHAPLLQSLSPSLSFIADPSKLRE